MFNPLFVNPLFVCLFVAFMCLCQQGMVCWIIRNLWMLPWSGAKPNDGATVGREGHPGRVAWAGTGKAYTCFNSVLYSYFTRTLLFFYMYSYSSTCSFPCGTTVVDPCPRLDGPGVGTIMKAVETERRQESPPEERPEERPEDQVQEEQDEITKI